MPSSPKPPDKEQNANSSQLPASSPVPFPAPLPEGDPDSFLLWSSHRPSPAAMAAFVEKKSDPAAMDIDFTVRLAKLSDVALMLTRAANVDDLSRAAVELGRSALGFDRLGILLKGEEPGVLYGTFGTDEVGNLRDERTFSFAITQTPLLVKYIQEQDQREPALLNDIIRDQNFDQIATGWNAVVGIWDDGAAIGYLFVDNLLHQRPYRPEDHQILRRYAATLGHLFTHFRIEKTLSQRRTAANRFLNQMSTLSKVIAALTMSGSFDELCYNAIDLGRQELGFDRLGLWFTTDEPEYIIGSYGTDEHGNIRDERRQRFAFLDDYALGKRLRSRERYVFESGTLINAPDGTPLHLGWKAAAALWNGEQIVGYLFTDNLLHGRPYSENEGELLGLYALLLGHLCTRLRIEATLRERETSYRTLIDAIPDYMFVVTRDGLILDYHEAQPATLAMPMAEMVGKTVHDVVYKKAANRYMAAIEEAFATGQVITFEYPLRYETADQGMIYYYLEVRVTAGNNDKVIILVRDVTNRKLLEDQLAAAQKMESLGRMASGIAHDFNNLLTVIQGFSSLATKVAADGPPRLIKALERINLASEKGARLTHQLLLFARKQVVQPQILYVNQQIQALSTIMESLLGETIALALHCDSTTGCIYMDPGQFEQVLVNLAVNARDAMPTGGCFSIATCNVSITANDTNQWLQLPSGLYVLIEVSDTGLGMSDEVQRQIFEPFFTTKEIGKGTGLGLAICHGIVQQNGGHIQVHSQVGKGTVFSIYLPISLRQPEEPRKFIEQKVSVGSETILLVEDDEPVRAVAAEVLSSHGYKVLECAGGKEALQYARDYPDPINLLLTDMMMPQMTGHEVAEQFMQLRPDVPILFVSGYIGELPDSFVNKPNVRFLSKPYTLLHLTEAVRTSIDEPWNRHSESLP